MPLAVAYETKQQFFICKSVTVIEAMSELIFLQVHQNIITMLDTQQYLPIYKYINVGCCWLQNDLKSSLSAWDRG